MKLRVDFMFLIFIMIIVNVTQFGKIKHNNDKIKKLEQKVEQTIENKKEGIKAEINENIHQR